MACRLFLLLSILLLWSACGTDNQERDPGTPDLVLTGDPDIDRITRQLQTRPDDAQLYATRAGLYLQREQLEAAEKDIQRAIARDSSQAEWYVILYELQFDLGSTDAAERTLTSAVDRFPDITDLKYLLVELYTITERYENATQLLDRMQPDVAQDDPRLPYLRAIIAGEQGDVERAVTYYRQALALQPDYYDALADLAVLLAQQSDPQAEPYFESALLVNPNDIELMMEQAMYYANRRDFDRANEIYADIARQEPQYVDAYLESALIYLTINQPAEAERLLRLATQMEVTYAPPYFYLGVIAQERGDLATARQYYEQALNLDPMYADAQEALGLLQ